MLCPGELIAAVTWIPTREPDYNFIKLQINRIACTLKVNPISSKVDVRLPGGPRTWAYALILRIDKCR